MAWSERLNPRSLLPRLERGVFHILGTLLPQENLRPYGVIVFEAPLIVVSLASAFKSLIILMKVSTLFQGLQGLLCLGLFYSQVMDMIQRVRSWLPILLSLDTFRYVYCPFQTRAS